MNSFTRLALFLLFLLACWVGVMVTPEETLSKIPGWLVAVTFIVVMVIGLYVVSPTERESEDEFRKRAYHLLAYHYTRAGDQESAERVKAGELSEQDVPLYDVILSMRRFLR